MKANLSAKVSFYACLGHFLYFWIQDLGLLKSWIQDFGNLTLTLMSYLYENNSIASQPQGGVYNRPFATSNHMVQNLPCWRESSLFFPHLDIKTKASQAWLVQVSLF